MSNDFDNRTLAGLRRIGAERARQVEQEGHAPDDDRGRSSDLFYAASRYADLAGLQLDLAKRTRVSVEVDGERRDLPISGPAWDATPVPFGWPASVGEWKPQTDPIRNAERAGALLAAGIDALLAEQSTPTPERN